VSTEELESLGENLKSMLAKSVSNGAGATEVADLEMPASPPRDSSSTSACQPSFSL